MLREGQKVGFGVHHVIHSKGLGRRFGRLTAVAGLDLDIPEATISAFLGPNGAGKTTTIRLLLGLLKAQEGTCEVLGLPPGHPAALAQIGAMVESPSLYAHLTGLENVEITRRMKDAPRSESDRVLSIVGLMGDAKRPVRDYSLGMRQRLGLALALIGNPKLLVLDEPTNGLDPAGIQEMRELLRSFPRETGATVFLSSHLLAEVEQLAEHLVVIHKGRTRYQGSLSELGMGEPARLRLRVDNSGLALGLMKEMGISTAEDQGTVFAMVPEADVPHLVEALVGAGLAIYEVAPEHRNLESRFLALVED
jgi:ABC-2 type transport system ATP-binding protein